MRARKWLALVLGVLAASPGPLLAAEPALAPLPAAPGRSGARPPPWLHRGRLGTLQLQSPTKGAAVQIDGLEVGAVPLKPLPLAPGAHELKLTRPGYRPHLQRIRVQPGKKLRVQVALKAVKAVLHVAAQVPGARVLVDGRDVGQAPLAGLEVAPGRRRVRLQAQGYAPIEQIVTVRAGREYSLFRAAEAAAPLPALPALPDAPVAEGAAAPLVAEAPAPSPAASGARGVQAPDAAPRIAEPPPPLVAAKAPAPSRAIVPEAVAAPAAPSAEPVPLTKRWYFWGGAAAVATAAVVGIVYALPARYVEKRDPTQACSGPCGVVINR